MTARPPIIVVGAGLGGLSAAVVLAARGQRVLVVEAAGEIGGKAGIATVDGVSFDTGPSLLTLPDLVDAVFRIAGTTLAEEVGLTAPDPAFRYLWADGARLDIRPTVDATLDEIRRTFGEADAREFADFLAYSARIWEASRGTFVEGPRPGLASVLAVGWRAVPMLWAIDPLRSMWGAITARVRSPHLRMLLARYATYNGSDVRVAPAALNCITHVELTLGGFGVRGGIHELARALWRVAHRHGAELRTGARVVGLDLAGPRVRGVILSDGRQIPAAAVVCNGEVGEIAHALLPAGTRHGLPNAPLSASGYTAVARCAPSPDRAAHTVLFPEDYLAEFADLFDRQRPPATPTVYLCAQSIAHGRPGWSDGEPVFLMANAPAEPRSGHSDPAAWPALRDTMRRRVVDAGLLHPDDAIVWERTPTALAARYPYSRGAIYGASSNDRFAAFRRAPNAVTGVPGLFIAGGGAHPGGGMPMVIRSGHTAADAALGWIQTTGALTR